MRTWIALLRGVNVGGRNRLAMKDLSDLLESFGCAAPRTYIQSGNAVFEADDDAAETLAADLPAAIEARFGFHPNLHLQTATRLADALDACPFPTGADQGRALHFFFLAAPADPAKRPALEALKAPSERFALTDRVFYLHAPDGFGRSKLASRAEAELGVSATARNLRTVKSIAELAGLA